MSTRRIVRAGLVAALYVVLTLPFGVFSYGPVQVRVSEALTVLPILMPEAIPGLVVGVLIANTFGPFGLIDVVLGASATLLGAIGTRLLRKRRLLALSCPVIANALIVPAYLPLLLAPEDFLPWFGVGYAGLYAAGVLTVGLGEAVAVYGLGSGLLAAIRRLPEGLFDEL